MGIIIKFKYSKIVLLAMAAILVSCSSDSDYERVSPVVVDLTQVPYQTLSEYQFFEGELNEMQPAYGVLPFKPTSALFTDYASKSRFVWMPSGSSATYNGDGKILELPVGAALVKSFYYDNALPSNTRKIIETRVMIRKQTGWIYANYIWNDSQTEAFLNLEGQTTNITFTDEGGTVRTAEYQIPSEMQCAICHEISNVHKPIGIKPQNLNSDFQYAGGAQNQLEKWIDVGYLESVPESINSIVDYNDTSHPVALRVRSYFDSNCAHCHQVGGYAEFFALRFEFEQTTSDVNMGLCVENNHFMPGFNGRLVTPGDIDKSMVYRRITTNDPFYRMPFVGRSIIHEEGAELVAEWINSLTDCP